MKRYLPLSFVALFLLCFRIANLTLRFSDSSIYWYTAYKLTHGAVLYKDIFFTNFPLFPYLSVIYFFLTGGNFLLYSLTPTLEIIIIAYLLFFLVYQRSKDTLVAFISSILYLFSFLVLSTSDHQTGVFLATLFSIISYAFFERKRYILSAIFIGITLMIKAYFLPIALAFIAYLLLQKNKKPFLVFFGTLIVTCYTILLPFFLVAPKEIIHDVFYYSLTRSQGVPKIDIAWFFILKDPLFFLLLIFNLMNFRRQLLFALISLLSILFFFLYQDIYYLYLNFLPAFLALSYVSFSNFIDAKAHPQRFLIPSLVVILLAINMVTYLNGYAHLNSATNPDKLVSAIKKGGPKVLYGSNNLAPLFSYLTQIPLVNNLIDTNPNIFRKGLLNKTKLTKETIKEKGMIITQGAYYPQVGVDQKVTDEIIDTPLLKRYCTFVTSVPFQTEGFENTINLFRCF